MGGASAGGGSVGDHQPCYKCVFTHPPLHPMDQMEEDQCAVVWLSRHFSEGGASLPSDGHQLIISRDTTQC